MTNLAKQNRRSRFPLPGLFVLFALLTAIPQGGAGESAISGIWRGEMEIPGGDSQELKITARRQGDRFSGTIAVPSDRLSFPIDRGEYDDGYLLLSGISKVTIPDGSQPTMRFVFEGFLDETERVWTGNWFMTDLDDNPAGGAGFILNKAGGGGGSDGGPIPPAPTPGPTGRTGLISVPPKTASGAGIPDMAGIWEGRTLDRDDDSSNPAILTLKRSGDSYSGNIVITDEEGENVEMDIHSGTAKGGSFEASGTVQIPLEDGETLIADFTIAGPVKGDSWNAVVVASYEGQQIVSKRIGLRRIGGQGETGSPPVPPAETKPGDKPGIGGMGGGKTNAQPKAAGRPGGMGGGTKTR
ncbi:MAG: hypothetical protein LBU64_09205 [Planctomycetota bacterium]|jgi:hypothetical protein|nr:hypothetical protein [Planctomycetota bacterium]